MHFESHSETQTEAIAANLAHSCKIGTIVALHGHLGCGKTVFARGFAKALGIHDSVTSPTFTIVQEYAGVNHPLFYHLDLYRINNEDEAIAFGIDEYIFNPHAISLIEWPERITALLPSTTIHVYLAHINEQTRSITI